MQIKSLLIGIALILLIGIGGFFYRSVKEQPTGPIACTADAKLCPDGTGVGREGPNCIFPTCPPPNAELPDANIAFALPAGYVETNAYANDQALVAAYAKPDTTSPIELILIRRYALPPEISTAEFIRENAILDPSGLPASPTAFTSTTINGRRYSVVQIGRFEGTVDMAYYLSRENEVVRFDAISLQVTDWTDPALKVETLAAQQDLRALLATLQGN